VRASNWRASLKHLLLQASDNPLGISWPPISRNDHPFSSQSSLACCMDDRMRLRRRGQRFGRDKINPSKTACGVVRRWYHNLFPLPPFPPFHVHLVRAGPMLDNTVTETGMNAGGRGVGEWYKMLPDAPSCACRHKSVCLAFTCPPRFPPSTHASQVPGPRPSAVPRSS